MTTLSRAFTPVRQGLMLASTLCLAAVLAVRAAPDASRSEEEAGLVIDGRLIKAARLSFEAGASGLPSQITIEPDGRELPLELRVPGSDISDATLAEIGRGKRLRAPMRLVATVDGRRTDAQVTQPGAITYPNDGGATCTATVVVGPYDVELTTRYDATGALAVRLTYELVRQPPATLALELDLVGPVNLVYRPAPSAPADESPLAGLDLALKEDEGVVWDSLKGPGGRPGPVGQFFVGTGDGGFSWHCEEEPQGWGYADDHPTMLLERDELGRLTWRVLLVADPAKTRGQRTVGFVVRVHPARPKSPGYRAAQWLDWPTRPDGAVAAPTILATGPTFMAAAGRYGEMLGPAAAAIVSAQRDNVDLYQPSVFRMAAGTWSDRTMRIRSNIRQLRPGDDPGLDRQILGRAVSHDIGVAIAGVAQPIEHLRLVGALRRFGYFEDGDTEFIPYWRSGAQVRFGEGFDPTSAFELTEDNPAAHTYVSVYRRPLEVDGRKGYKALFVIMNERDEPTRQHLYLRAPERLLGPGGSTLTGLEIVYGYDYGTIPDDSDWRREKVGTYQPMFGATGLADAEDGGYVKVASSKGDTAAIYGPIYITRHNYRILYGHWLPANVKN